MFGTANGSNQHRWHLCQWIILHHITCLMQYDEPSSDNGNKTCLVLAASLDPATVYIKQWGKMYFVWSDSLNIISKDVIFKSNKKYRHIYSNIHEFWIHAHFFVHILVSISCTSCICFSYLFSNPVFPSNNRTPYWWGSLAPGCPQVWWCWFLVVWIGSSPPTALNRIKQKQKRKRWVNTDNLVLTASCSRIRH